ncbi:hypothetical protein M407DRAFT_32658 [Tulasnella calospora MUT 4182]|uniref:Uncharacterized protein n=1 Tax=Tulasnella calospora MUT 4182 TaxID=1051891 RepID=A0A0C3L802_9AGAM|nr:hypothetical protein M407DRAFT_32658 [Tulasnella calospora MUT 4182]
MPSELLVSVVAVIVFAVLCTLIIVALKVMLPGRPGPPLPMEDTFNPLTLTQYRSLIQSTVDWLDSRGLPLSRYTRVILDRLLPRSNAPVLDFENPTPAPPVALQRPTPCHH